MRLCYQTSSTRLVQSIVFPNLAGPFTHSVLGLESSASDAQLRYVLRRRIHVRAQVQAASFCGSRYIRLC